MSLETVEVVAGIVFREGRILQAQRPAKKDFPFMWECPGGKVEGNESHHDALRREWKEELGVHVHAINENAVWSGWFENLVSRADRSKVFVLFYVCAFEGEPKLNEHQGLGWFTYEEWLHLVLSPATGRAAAAIERIWPEARGSSHE